MSLPLNRKRFTQEWGDGEFPHRGLLLLLEVCGISPPTLEIAILNIRISKRYIFRVRSIVRISRLQGSRAFYSRPIVWLTQSPERSPVGKNGRPLIFHIWFHCALKSIGPPTVADHQKAREILSARAKTTNSDRPLSCQACALYLIRFISAADVAGAWGYYGGVIAQLNNLGNILAIAATENVRVDLDYFDFLHAQLESYARSRVVGAGPIRLFPCD